MLEVKIKSITRRGQRNSIVVIQNINFRLESGRSYTILGKNGSGKTTLIKSLTNLLNNGTFEVSGKVLFENKDILTIDYESLQALRQKEIRYVLQDLTNNFDPLKKLKYYFDLFNTAESKLNSILNEFLLPEYKIISQLYPYEISGGMAQRLSFLFALLPNPKLLILDEPTSAIDYTNINLVKLKLDEHKALGNTALIVTQDIQFAKEVSDEIAFLSDRTLTDFKSVNSFFSEPELIYSGFLKAFEDLK